MTDIVSISIAEGTKYFAFAFEHGFSIYSINPLQLKFKKDFINFTLTCISTNFDGTQTAFAVKSLNPNSSIQKVYIWNSFYDEMDKELEFTKIVRCVCIRKTVLVVVLTDSVCLYDIQKKTLNGLEQITFQNIAGACDVSFSEENPKFAICGLTPGAIQIFTKNENSIPILVSAHLHPITCIKFSPDCKMIATASEQGTLIRVFDVINGALLCVFRRGNLRSQILAMCFSPCNKKLLVLSTKGTLHLFNTQEQRSSEENPCKSCSKLHIETSPHVEMSFQDENNAVVISSSGIVTRVKVDGLNLSFVMKQVALSH